jgi:hypothetical protein
MKMEKKLFRLRFEPVDVEAYTPEEAMLLYNMGRTERPVVCRVYLVDKDGFPVA